MGRRILGSAMALSASLFVPACGNGSSSNTSPGSPEKIVVSACEGRLTTGEALSTDNLLSINHMLWFAKLEVAVNSDKYQNEASMYVAASLPGGEEIKPQTFIEPENFQALNLGSLVCAGPDGFVYFAGDDVAVSGAEFTLAVLQQHHVNADCKVNEQYAAPNSPIVVTEC